MIVLHLNNCPAGLRGDLTKWLFEIASGVFIGQVTTRVRDELWLHVIENCKNGSAVIVYNTNNEQRLDFRVHGETWEPIDFDGIKLMLRPSASRLRTTRENTSINKKNGFSNASKYRNASRYASKNYVNPNK